MVRIEEITTAVNHTAFNYTLRAYENIFSDEKNITRQWDVRLSVKVEYYIFGDSDYKWAWEIKRDKKFARALRKQEKQWFAEYYNDVIPWIRSQIYNAILNEDPEGDERLRTGITLKERKKAVKDVKDILGDYEKENKD